MTKQPQGCIYLRYGRIYWIKYKHLGKWHYESSNSEEHKAAEKLLLQRQIEAEKDQLPNTKAEKTRFDDLAEDLLRDYRICDKKSTGRVSECIGHLKGVFEGIRAHDIGTTLINSYIDKRKTEGAANGTINRELSSLRRMFNLGLQQTPAKVLRKPFIKLLPENNARKGFFEHDEFRVLHAVLSEHLKPIVTLAYYTGMRKGEILGLKWNQVDLKEGVIRLYGEDTKNSEPRTIYMNDEVFRLLVAQKRDRDLKFPNMPWVFYTPEGEPVGDFRKAWKTACKKAGLQGKLFHDFRRTGVRNMIRSGVPERVAMAVSGHKTRSVFDRYNIVSEADLKLASQRVEAYTKAKEEADDPFKELEETKPKLRSSYDSNI